MERGKLLHTMEKIQWIGQLLKPNKSKLKMTLILSEV